MTLFKAHEAISKADALLTQAIFTHGLSDCPVNGYTYKKVQEAMDETSKLRAWLYVEGLCRSPKLADVLSTEAEG